MILSTRLMATFITLKIANLLAFLCILKILYGMTVNASNSGINAIALIISALPCSSGINEVK